MGEGEHHQVYKMADEQNDADFEIETTDSGASATQSVEAGQIRAGGYIMIKGKPCKVKSVSVSKTGKHGHAKCKFAATDIFTGATCEELCPSTHTIDVPFVTKKDWQIQGLQDETYVLLMDEDGEMREDLQAHQGVLRGRRRGRRHRHLLHCARRCGPGEDLRCAQEGCLSVLRRTTEQTPQLGLAPLWTGGVDV